MAFHVIYSGTAGSGLESSLAIYEAAKKAGLSPALTLSSSNQRAALIKKHYPQASLGNFLSPLDVLSMREKIGSEPAFFAMYSPKMLPLYFLVADRIFYFHATFDHSFSKSALSDAAWDAVHSLVIKTSARTYATQSPLAWSAQAKTGREVGTIPHPPFSLIRQGFFEGEKKVGLPFSDYFLCFGGIGRPSKGTQVLLKAVSGTSLPLVLAGRMGRDFGGANVCHLNRWVDDAELYWLIKNCRAVVLPYLVPSQFSACLSLAYVFGKPAIAPFCPAFEGWITEGKTGLFFSQGDAADLRAKLRQAQRDGISAEKKWIDTINRGREGACVRSLKEEFG